MMISFVVPQETIKELIVDYCRIKLTGYKVDWQLRAIDSLKEVQVTFEMIKIEENKNV